MKKLFCCLAFSALTAHAIEPEVKLQGTVVSVLSGTNTLNSPQNPITSVDFAGIVGTVLKALIVRSVPANAREGRAAESYYVVVGRESFAKGRDPRDNAPTRARLTLQLVPATVKTQAPSTLLDSFAYKAPKPLITVTAEAKTLDTEDLDSPQSLRDAVLSANDPGIGTFKVENLQFLMQTQ